MFVGKALIAAFLGVALSACTSNSNKPVVVPDRAVKPPTTSNNPQAGTGNTPNDTTSSNTTTDTPTTNPGTDAVNGTIAPNAARPSSGATNIPAITPPASGGGVAPPPAATNRPSTNLPSSNPPGTTPPSTTLPSTTPPSTTPSNNPPAAVVPPTQPGGDKTRLNELTVSVPAGFTLVQQAQADGVTMVSFAKGDDFAAIYSRSGGGMTTQSLFVNGAKVTAPESPKHVGNYDWAMIETTKTVRLGLPHAGTYFVAGFMMIKNAVTYYGYGKASSAENARSAAQAILSAVE